jgi:hypothetical protein
MKTPSESMLTAEPLAICRGPRRKRIGEGLKHPGIRVQPLNVLPSSEAGGIADMVTKDISVFGWMFRFSNTDAT